MAKYSEAGVAAQARRAQIRFCSPYAVHHRRTRALPRIHRGRLLCRRDHKEMIVVPAAGHFDLCDRVDLTDV
ncbi:hypothetical protein [Nocardia puris]|uniref:hypothetical protein n=1 Tax=Nocardia puris TaxID=208602 RepID=UPI0012F4D234|nr:hypothetical protein [Nocardia puris]